MRAFLAILILACPAVSGWAETFDLGESGRLEIFPVGEWDVQIEDVGELNIQLTPKNSQANAGCQLSVTPGGVDEYSTKGAILRKLTEVGRRMVASGQFVEGSPGLKTFYSKQGFGSYFTLTDRKLVGRAPVPGDYKQVSVGLIRLSAGVTVEVQIVSDGEKTEEFQQLLGTVEGMELQVK